MSIFERLSQGEQVWCQSPEATIALGEAVGEALKPGTVLALRGDLGAGKTTFTKGVGRSLGLPEADITSPTFNLYTIHQGRFQLIHVDAYRLSGPDAMDELLLDEFLTDPWVIVVEWSERGLAEWMTHVWTISFTRQEGKGTGVSLESS